MERYNAMNNWKNVQNQNFVIETVTSLPTFSAAEKGRHVVLSSTGIEYYNNGIAWIPLIQQLSISGSQLSIANGNTITLPTGSGNVELPENTFFVSPNYSNIEPYYNDFSTVITHINTLPGGVVYNIVLFGGQYHSGDTITNNVSIYGLGYSTIDDIICSTDIVTIRGYINIGLLTLNHTGLMIVDFEVGNISQLYAVSAEIVGKITAREITELNSMGGQYSIFAHGIGTVYVGGDPGHNIKIHAEQITSVEVTDEAVVTITRSNIGIEGSVSPVIMGGGCFLKLRDCRLDGYDNPAISVSSGDSLVLDNVLLLSNTTSIDFITSINLFVRGGCTANQDINGTFNSMNAIEEIIIEPNANEGW